MAGWDWDPDTYLPRWPPRSRATRSSRTPSPPRPPGIDAGRVLELGTGTGETALRVLARHPGAAWTGIDSSEPMLGRARERLPGADLRLARLEDPLPAGPFDLVVSVLAVHHLDGAR